MQCRHPPACPSRRVRFEAVGGWGVLGLCQRRCTGAGQAQRQKQGASRMHERRCKCVGLPPAGEARYAGSKCRGAVKCMAVCKYSRCHEVPSGGCAHGCSILHRLGPGLPPASAAPATRLAPLRLKRSAVRGTPPSFAAPLPLISTDTGSSVRQGLQTDRKRPHNQCSPKAPGSS